jgi:hypothetical protein
MRKACSNDVGDVLFWLGMALLWGNACLLNRY